MFIFGMALIPLFSKILMVPRRMLTISIVIFCFIGSFSINLNHVDLLTMVGFGVLGWGMQKFGFSQAALCIALILGPMMESNLRRGLLQTGDNVIEFISGPITPSVYWPHNSVAWLAIHFQGYCEFQEFQTSHKPNGVNHDQRGICCTRHML